MIPCLSYLNSMSDIVYKKYEILVHTINKRFHIRSEIEAGADLVRTIISSFFKLLVYSLPSPHSARLCALLPVVLLHKSYVTSLGTPGPQH